MEKYTSKDWAGLSRRARGPRNHRAARIKSRMAQHIQGRTDLTPSAKLVGPILVRWYNEKRGYSWPPNSILAAETGLTERSVHRATAELHELGIVHKVIGGGWDKGKIRHKSNLYYPAFSLVLESAEKPGNPPEYPDNLSSLTECQGTKSNNRRNSAEVPCQNVTPYGDKHMAGASASPSANAAASRPATPELEKLEDGLYHFQIKGIASHLGIDPEDCLAMILGIDETHMSKFMAVCEDHHCTVYGRGGEHTEALAFDYETPELELDGFLTVRGGKVVELNKDATMLTAESVLEIRYRA